MFLLISISYFIFLLRYIVDWSVAHGPFYIYIYVFRSVSLAAAQCYLRGFIPSARHSDVVPWDRWFGHSVKSDVSHLRVRGSVCWVTDLDRTAGKLSPQARKGRMVGYMGRRGYRVFDTERHAVYEVINVTFEEGIPHRSQIQAADEDASETANYSGQAPGTEDTSVDFGDVSADHLIIDVEDASDSRRSSQLLPCLSNPPLLLVHAESRSRPRPFSRAQMY
jgi:hypothetical protein